MKKYLILTGAVLTVLALNAPSMASAKIKVHAANNVSTSTATSTSNSRCIVPFGHMIAPGWLKKHNRATTTPSGCLIPFGIGKKFHATSTGSTTNQYSLRINDVDTSTASTSATISWHTNKPADSLVYYSSSSPVTVEASTTASVGSSAKVTDHQVTVSGLATSTTYYFLIRSTDVNGLTASESEFHLKTSSM